MRQNPCNCCLCNSACQNDNELSDDHPHCCIALTHSPQHSHGSKIPGAIKLPTSQDTEKNKSNKIETNISSIIVVAPRILTETEILATGLNDVGFPFKGQVRTQKMIKLLHFPSFFYIEPPVKNTHSSSFSICSWL